VNSAGTKWRYVNPAGSVRRVLVRDLSSKEPGLLRWSLKAESAATVTLPSSDAVRMSIVLGDVGECASVVFDPPSGVRPRCSGNADKLSCR
jgi:hypothetical protein